MNRRNAIKLAVLALLVAGVAALYFSPARTYLTKDHLRDLITWLRGLWYGPIVLIVLYAVGCVLAIPASVFVIAAGVIWGWKLGAVYAITGGMLGAIASYFVGGFLGEGLLDKFGSAGRAVRRQVESAGFTSMLIVRLIPGPPFAVWNYAAGIARVRFRRRPTPPVHRLRPAPRADRDSADHQEANGREGHADRRVMVLAATAISRRSLKRRRRFVR